jgi:hypothetical protein
VHDVRSAVTRHPDMVSLYTAIQIPASTMLLEECVQAASSSGITSDLFDHVIRPVQERLRDREAKGLGGLEVDDQFDLRRLLYR